MGRRARTRTIVIKPDGKPAGQVRSGKLGSQKVVCITAYNLDTAKAYIRDRGYTIKETETRGKRSHGTQHYCFYLGKKKKHK